MNAGAPLGLGVTVALVASLVAGTTTAQAQGVRFAVRVFEAWTPDRADSGSPGLRPKPAPGSPSGSAAPGALEPEAQIRRILPRLRSLFRYTEYRKVAHLRAEGPVGIPQSFSFPGNCSLEITPEKLLENRVQMRVLLREGGRVGLLTGILAPPGAPAILGGPAHGDGVLIIVLWANPTTSSPSSRR